MLSPKRSLTCVKVGNARLSERAHVEVEAEQGGDEDAEEGKDNHVPEVLDGVGDGLQNHRDVEQGDQL